MSDAENTPPGGGRRRSLTSITLNWIAERMRRAEQIKEQLDSGSYKVESAKVAAALLNRDGRR